MKDGQGIFSHFDTPGDLTVDRTGIVVVVDCCNHTFRSGGCWKIKREMMRKMMREVCDNHAIHVITIQVTVRTFRDNGPAGFADAQVVDTRFNKTYSTNGLPLDPEGNLLVTDRGINALRLVTMTGGVSTVVGNDEGGHVAYGVISSFTSSVPRFVLHHHGSLCSCFFHRHFERPGPSSGPRLLEVFTMDGRYFISVLCVFLLGACRVAFMNLED